MPEIREGRSYCGSGNAASRSFLADGFGAAHPKILHLFDSQAEARSFANVRNALLSEAGKPARVAFLADERGFWSFVAADAGEFAATYGAFEKNRYSAYSEGKRVFFAEVGSPLSERGFVDRLVAFGYAFAEHCDDPWTYRRGGDTVFVRLDDGEYAAEFFDGTVESVRKVRAFPTGEPTTGPECVRNRIRISDRSNSNPFPESPETFDPSAISAGKSASVILHDPDFSRHAEIVKTSVPGCVSFLAIRRGDAEDLGVFEPEIPDRGTFSELLSDKKNRFSFRTKRPETALAAAKESGRADVATLPVPNGVRIPSYAVPNELGGVDYALSDDVLAPVFVRNRTGRTADRMDLLLKISPGDAVVHRDYGIGIFRGCERKKAGNFEREFVRVEYAGDDTLFVPLSEAYRLSKYLGDGNPPLSKLGGAEWKKAVERAEEDAEKVARELLDIYAKRKIARRDPYPPRKKEEAAFRAAFPYAHTADQARAIEEILADLEETEPMDRLLSGDVGFWKTEVAMNAAYRVALAGRQVAFVSPLVVLAYEHADSLSKRFEAFGMKIAVLTRFTRQREETATLSGLRKGEIDIVVGTHRLLSGDVKFKDLGLLVVDEEHRFGVLDKEKITAIRENVDVLSLSATPIPRSLNLALSGVRKVSILTTPPPRKKAIATSVGRWDEKTVGGAVRFELDRGGQAIVLHNRVATLEKTEKEIRHSLGTAGKHLRIAVTHGQMSGTELEDRILEFKDGKYDVLLSTTVIENGVNFLRANTIVIDDADEFGLASLHQLRGRVGRKDEQAYCHLLYRKELLPDDAKKRLAAIAGNSHLGAGFEISMRDLEIRGAGEILGLKQSGRTKETGLPLYFRLLEEKVNELSAGKKRSPDAKIELDFPYGIPDAFFESEIDKIHFFRSLESVADEDELDSAHATFLGKNAELPEETENLFALIRARVRLTALKIASLKKSGNAYLFEFSPGTTAVDFRKFLELDARGEFVFLGNGKIRADAGGYRNDAEFLKYLLSR